jgi:hypothetical protein
MFAFFKFQSSLPAVEDEGVPELPDVPGQEPSGTLIYTYSITSVCYDYVKTYSIFTSK